MNKKLTESLENYLETIGMLVRENKIARVKDISKKLNVKNSSVNIALNVLADKGLIIHEKYGYVELTKEGQKIADDIQYKEDILLRFFTEILGVDKDIALKDACRMEHTISDETLAKLIFFIGKVDKEASFKKAIQKNMKE
jgi:DtxR family Mn-dependent transcriptional regulator